MELVLNSRKAPKLFSSIDATAFASIMVVLLFIVWIANAAPSPHRGVSTDLPKVLHPVSMPSALREDAMKVTILRDGRVYFGSDRINVINLPAKIQDHLKDREAERKVYVVADMRARWSDVEMVLDGVRSAGILRVAFLVN